ncbi:MAG: hypothetical protein V7L30_29180 [Nostoc sp.]|uniref:hypothetical protein n=1 Tax=Nostoc sp. TaxID=1180 RepID=UPI002FF71FBC
MGSLLPSAFPTGRCANVLLPSEALFARFSWRGEANFAEKLLSAMRYQFGGYDEKANS